jgi:hypothetical protein
MKDKGNRLKAALKRTSAELNNAILKRTAYNQLCKAGFTYTGTSFFEITGQALFNDMMAGAIRVFDDHKDVTSIWYIIRCNEGAAKKAAAACGISIASLRAIVPKLRQIRDKTHFHIDREAVEAPQEVWKRAGISGNELTDALYGAATLIAHIKREIYGGELEKPTPYDGSDVHEIVKAYMAFRDADS